MKNVFIKLPVYAGDVSGAASALYELGGMSVIHDPSGCNSTYNTHDETRWYSKESLIFVSGLSEIDAITGNDDKFIKDILDAAGKLKPRFIAVFNSPIPYINGTDFKGIARIIEKKSSIPTFHIETNAMHDYSVGISNAFYEYALKFLPEKRESGINKNVKKINIIGMTPLDYAGKDSTEKIKKIFEERGYEILSVWAEGSRPEELNSAVEADMNLIISSAGIKLGKYLEEKYGIPNLFASPIARLSEKIIGEIEKRNFEKLFKHREKTDVVVVGESLISLSLSAEYKLETGEDADVISTTELGGELLGENDRFIRNEAELKTALENYKRIIGDPLYKRIAPKTAEFIEIPHLAFSGRLFLNSIPDFLEMTFLQRETRSADDEYRYNR